MILVCTIMDATGCRRAEALQREDGLFQVAVYERIHELVPEFGVDEHVWVDLGARAILTDQRERAIELARAELGLTDTSD